MIALPKEAIITNESQTEFWVMKMIDSLAIRFWGINPALLTFINTFNVCVTETAEGIIPMQNLPKDCLSDASRNL